MLSYRLQKRHLKIVEGGLPAFPNDVRIEMQLGPPTPFGLSVGGGLTATQNVKAQSLIDANTGRSSIASESAFPPVEVFTSLSGMAVEVRGDILAVETRCDSAAEMSDILLTVYHVFPALLNIEFFDPPIVVRVFGSVGNSKFRWELSQIQATAQITNTVRQQVFITAAFERMATQLAGGRNRRLVAAVHYFHVACRLLAAGQSPWEFMGEVVLNFAKTLQALFGQQGDDVRAGLRRLGGYSAEEIEAFVTVMGLRDSLDSSHIMLSVMTEAQAEALRFVYGRELQFRRLLTRVFEEVGAGHFAINEEPDLSLDTDKVRLFEWINKANRIEGPAG